MQYKDTETNWTENLSTNVYIDVYTIPKGISCSVHVCSVCTKVHLMLRCYKNLRGHLGKAGVRDSLMAYNYFMPLKGFSDSPVFLQNLTKYLS